MQRLSEVGGARRAREADIRRSVILRLIGEGLRLGATVFGGMNQAYPIIREGGWLPPAEVDGLYAISVFLPGPSFLNLWGAVSARVAGLPGAVLAQAALLLPAFLLVLTLPLLAHLPWIAARTAGALAGATWATAGILLSTGLGVMRKLKSPRHLGLVAADLGLLTLGVHPLLLLVGSVAFGVLRGRAD